MTPTRPSPTRTATDRSSHRSRPSRRSLGGALAAAGVAVALLAGCGSSPAERSAPDAETTTVPAPTTPTADESPATTVAPDAPAVRIARTDEALVVRAAPDENAALVTSLPATTVFGSPRALLVVDDADGWVEVQVPQRPNGGTGWVESDRVDLVAGSYTVTVDRAARSLTVTEVATDAVVLETAVAIGAPDAPTPTGTFSVVDRLETPNPAGAYGPFALGLSGFSETLSEFGGGNGQIAIHGTDDPSSIGRDVSHGCIRVPNDVVLRLAELLPLGTPVTIS